ncbi:MAG: PAS domain-containing protein [Verrucomicrobia bacterium]|nr:PAS domain-containing protein [Verrucomicrobiota bacterium]
MPIPYKGNARTEGPTAVTNMSVSIDSFHRHILDAMPLMVFVVDDDVRVVYANTMALGVLRTELGSILNTRGGEVFHCLHAMKTPEGCGRGAACKDCVIRNSVGQSFGGQKVFRSRARMTLLTPAGEKDAHMLITTAPLALGDRHCTLLTIEDISEIMDMKMLIPICAHCKRIRNDQEYWQQLDEFLHQHLDVDFSHGICPNCLREHYPKVADRVLDELKVAERPAARLATT